MSSKLLTAPEREGKTFHIAIRILGAVAVFQIVLAIWTVLIRFNGEEINRGNILNLAGSFQPPAQAASSEKAAASSPLPDAHSPSPGPEAPPPATGLPAAGAPDSFTGKRDASPGPAGTRILLAQHTPAAPSLPAPAPNLYAHRISIPEVADQVDRALLLREQGDCQGALEILRQADSKLPIHPKILGEIAATLQQMGLDAKAAEYWERVHQLGPAGAGAYWDLADMALKGQILDEASSLETYLRISRHTARVVPSNEGTQHVVLRIHIDSAQKKPLSGDDMYLNVLFYDAVNDTTFEPTVADTKPVYVTQPYDWRDGSEEIIEVDYFLPKLTQEQLATLGQRRFFGYVVELYYKDLLQDIIASPRKLARLGSSASRAARPIRQALPPK